MENNQGRQSPFIPHVRPGDGLSARRWNQIAQRLNRPYDYGGGDTAEALSLLSAVAKTTTIIPGRVGLTPGGPISVTIQESFPAGSDFVAGDTVQVLSWVQTPSADPADQPNDELYIYIEQDFNGVWWFTAQDCTMPATSIDSWDATADLVVTTSIQPIPGTAGVLSTFEGIYSYELFAEIEVTGIQGNQAWDVDIGLWDSTDAQWLYTHHWAGNGDIPFNPTLNISTHFNSAGYNGHSIELGAIRNTTRGTITVLYQNPITLLQATGHSITGPF